MLAKIAASLLPGPPDAPAGDRRLGHFDPLPQFRAAARIGPHRLHGGQPVVGETPYPVDAGVCA
jgi:hypothetical protein